MDKSSFDRTVALLLPYMNDVNSREALVQSALFGLPVLNHITWTGAATPFTIALVQQLTRFDITAVIAVLKELRNQVGTTRQAEIDVLIQDLSHALSPKKGNKMTVEPAILIGFLLEIGRWAKNELSERWKVRREQQAADLTQKSQVDAAIPTMLQAAANTSSPQRVQETIDLIERKRDAINRARNAKMSDREELDRKEIPQSAFEEREKRHNKIIRQMLDEIESDLNDLGFEVEREPA